MSTLRALVLKELPKALEKAGYRPEWKELNPIIAALRTGKKLSKEDSISAASALQYLAIRIEIENRTRKRGNPGARASQTDAAVAARLIECGLANQTEAIVAALGPSREEGFDRVKQALNRQKNKGGRRVNVDKKLIEQAKLRLKPKPKK